MGKHALDEQDPMRVVVSNLPMGDSRPVFIRLNRLLAAEGFDCRGACDSRERSTNYIFSHHRRPVILGDEELNPRRMVDRP